MPATTITAAGQWLADDAAASYARARAAGMPSGVTSAGRTPAEQAALYAAYQAGTGALAARPGTSRHELGEALDLPAGPRAWMLAHPEHGWRRTIAAEPWHFEYTPTLDIAAHPTTPTTATTLEDPTMLLIHHTNGTDQAYYVWDGRGLTLVPPSPQYPDLAVLRATLRVVEATGPTGLDPYRRVAQGLTNSRP